MLLTDPEILEKIQKKESMVNDLKIKTKKIDDIKNQNISMTLKKAHSSAMHLDSEEQSHQSYSKLKKGSKRHIRKVIEQAPDHLPFPDLTKEIAQRLPGCPIKPTLNLIFDDEFFKRYFKDYCKEVKKVVSAIMKPVRT